MYNIIIHKDTLLQYSQEHQSEGREARFINYMTDSPDELIEVDLKVASFELIKFMILHDTHLSNEMKEWLRSEVVEKHQQSNAKLENELWDTKINTLSDVWRICEILNNKQYNTDYEFYERHYPVKTSFKLNNATRIEPKNISFSLELTICEMSENVFFKLKNQQILNLRKEIKDLTFRKLMAIFKIYEQKIDLSSYLDSLRSASGMQINSGMQIECKGLGLYHAYSEIKSVYMNAYEQRSLAIIESELELKGKSTNHINDSFKTKTDLPYIRIFSLYYKSYFYIHIDDISEYVYDMQAFEKLVLPATTKNLIERVFSYSSKQLYGDIINYKHGGLIIMAEGNPGVGKTSTAEVYSELNKKPLYVVQIYEIGTNVHAIEENLAKIFKRVEKWEAIILFDEIDVMLSKRNDNLEKNAIVGVFLRLMDYFRGIMFLTTNRIEVIDDAVLSRITINIKYPDFTIETRKKIWELKLEDAGLSINSMDRLIKLNMNGRQIRNMVRLGKIIYIDKINQDEFIKLIKISLPGSSAHLLDNQMNE
jgi:hypothetical protein